MPAFSLADASVCDNSAAAQPTLRVVIRASLHDALASCRAPSQLFVLLEPSSAESHIDARGA
jgi:hypothetical protein